MMMVYRCWDYAELLERMVGKRPLIWTCNTCARLCNGAGGREAAERLAEALRGDGVDVFGVAWTSAACLGEKVVRDLPQGDYDCILTLTCDQGSHLVSEVSGKDVEGGLCTYGPGYMTADGRLFVCGILVSIELGELIEEGCELGPYL